MARGLNFLGGTFMDNNNRLVRTEKLDSQRETLEEKLAFDSLSESFEKFCALAEACLIKRRTFAFNKYLKFFQRLSWGAECMATEFDYAMRPAEFCKEIGVEE